MSGRELSEEIQWRLPGVPILCTSGFVRPASADENEACLAKPYTSQQLLRQVKELLVPSEDRSVKTAVPFDFPLGERLALQSNYLCKSKA